MSTIESYGVSGDGGVGGSVHNNNNSGPPASSGVMNMRLGFSPDGGAAVYKSLMPPNSSHSASATPAPNPAAYQASGGDGSAVSGSATPSIITPATGESVKRKRGRPKKYAVDGTMAGPVLTSPPPPHVQPPPPPPQTTGLQPGGFSSPSPAAVTQPSLTGKKRGRPPGSGRKLQANDGTGSAGVDFTPHVITVKAGEDVASKVVSFSQNGTQTLSILSANGAISNVTLRQSTSSGGTVTYEGRFEILSLHGTYTLVETDGQRSRSGGLTVVLAGPDGRVLGGNVAGLLVAASPVQLVVACFVVGPDLKQPIQADPLSAYPRFVPGSSGGGAASSASRGTLSESSGGPVSPHNQSTEACNNSNNNFQQDMNTYAWK